MPEIHTSQNTPPKQNTQSASSLAGDARERVQATASTVQHKAAEVKRELLHGADALASEHVSDVARNVVAAGRDTAAHAVEQGRELLRQGSDAAHERYEATRRYAVDVAQSTADAARTAGQRAADYLGRANEATSGFVSTHALPLTFVGLGLGWLAWSIQRDLRRRQSTLDVSYARPRSPSASELDAARRRQPMLSTAPTTTGARLIGVRTTGAGYDD